MELPNRDDLESSFALRISRLTAKQRREFEILLGFPPDINNVPPEAWERWERELNDDMLILLLIIASASYRQHGGLLVPPAAPAFDQSLAALLGKTAEQPPSPVVQWARGVSSQTAAGWADNSREMLRIAADDWADPETPDPTKSSVRDTGLKIFGPGRAARMAVNETTRAQHRGSEEAISTTVGLSDEDRWFTVNDRRVCPICTPLHDTPRSYWGRFFPGGPPDPHPLCRCYIVFQNQLQPVGAVAESFRESWDESKHPRDDNGRFVSGDAITAAKSDPAKAKELRAKVTKPDERKKLEKALGVEKGGEGAGGEKPAESGKSRKTKEPPSSPAHAEISFTKTASQETKNAVNAAMQSFVDAGAKTPRITIVSDDATLGNPARSNHVMLRFNPDQLAKMQANDAETQKKWGVPAVVDSSHEGVARHEMTHSLVTQSSEADQSRWKAESSKLMDGSKKWLSMQAEMNPDEFLAELGSAYLGGKKLPEPAAKLARDMLGIKEPTTDKKPAAQHVTESPAFKSWFGDSKVVDASGNPLVVYKAMSPHDWTKETKDGPGPEIKSINRSTEFPSFNKGEPGVKIAGFFGSKDIANQFANNPNAGMTAIYPAYLSFQTPFIIDAKGAKAGDTQFGEKGRAFRDAIRSGKHDSVIIKDTADEGDLYVALKPEQIKSATGNRGTFDLSSPNITESQRG